MSLQKQPHTKINEGFNSGESIGSITANVNNTT